MYEAGWYHAADDEPDVRPVAGAKVGVLTCTDLWRMEWARLMGEQGANIIVTPRATGDGSVDKWLAAGRVAAISSGAYSLSSNRVGDGFGGGGWVYSPDGDLLAQTDQDNPTVTLELDLELAEQAKATYPRYAIKSDR